MARRVRVEEHEHAYLVRGTNDINVARKAVFNYLGKKKWARIAAMPYRPMNALELGQPQQSCVAMYFAIGPGAEPKYKP